MHRFPVLLLAAALAIGGSAVAADPCVPSIGKGTQKYRGHIKVTVFYAAQAKRYLDTVALTPLPPPAEKLKVGYQAMPILLAEIRKKSLKSLKEVSAVLKSGVPGEVDAFTVKVAADKADSHVSVELRPKDEKLPPKLVFTAPVHQGTWIVGEGLTGPLVLFAEPLKVGTGAKFCP